MKNIKIIRDILFNQYSVFKELLNIDGGDNFLNYFTNFDLSEIMDKIDKMELIDWISLKYRITMTIRYKIEKFIVSKDSKLKDDWCNSQLKSNLHNKKSTLRELSFLKINKEKKYLEMSKYLKNQDNKKLVEYLLHLNKRLNFINHLDNLKWVPLFEFPMYKLIKFLDLTIEKTK